MGNLLLPFTIGYHLKNKSETLELNIVDQSPSTASDLDKFPTTNTQTLVKKAPPTRLGAVKEIIKINLKPIFNWFSHIKLSVSPKEKGPRPKLRQDGFISSLMFFLVLISASFSVSLARWISEQQDLGVTPSTEEFCLLLNMTIACCIMWAFCLHKNHRFGFMKKFVLDKKAKPGLHNALKSFSRIGSQSLLQDMTGDNYGRGRYLSTNSEASLRLAPLIIKYVRSGIQNAIPLIGILIFFILGMFLDIIRIIAHGECMGVYVKCHMLSKYVISICSHGMRIIFQATVLVFTFKFHSKAFKQCTTVRYLLLIILAAMSAMWFDTLLFESSEIFADELSGPEKYGNKKCINMTNILAPNSTTPNITTGYFYQVFSPSTAVNIENCLNRTTGLYGKDEELSPYFYPLHIEFALMVCEIMFHLYFNVRDEDPIAEDITKTKTRAATKCKRSSTDSEAQPLLGNDTTGYGTLSEEPASISQIVSNPENEPSELEAAVQWGIAGSPQTQSEVSVDVHCTEESPMEISQSSISLSFPSNPEINQDNASSTTTARRRKCTPTSNGAVCTNEDLDRIDNTGEFESKQASTTHDPSGANTQEGNTSSKAVRRKKKQTRGHSMKGLPRVFAPAMVLSIVLITLGGLTYLDNESVPEIHLHTIQNCSNSSKINCHWRQNYECYKLIYFFLMIVTIITGFVSCKNSLPKFKPYQGLDMLIIMVTFGFYLHTFLTVIADVNYIRGTESRNPYVCNPMLPPSYSYTALLGKIFNMLEVYLQTTFYMHSGRIKFSKGQEKSRSLLKNCLVALAISNLSLWFVDSFVEVKNPYLEPMPAYYYTSEKWHLISQIFFPLSLFYRFNSFLLIISVFLEH